AQLELLENGATAEQLEAARSAAQASQQRYLLLQNGYRREDVEAARAQASAARSNLATAQTDYERYLRLHQAGAVPRQVLEARKNLYEQARAGYESSQENLDKLRAGPRPEERGAALEEYRAAEARYQDLASGTRPEQVAQARALLREREEALQLMLEGARPQEVQAARKQVDEARAALEAARTNLSKTRLEAQADGVVLSKNFEVGETVGSGASVYTVAELTRPWVTIFLPETDLAKVKLGASASVRVDSLPGKSLTGRVSRIYEQAEFTPKFIQTPRERVNLVYRARVEVDNPDLLLRPGMPADVEIAR
ncbi:MAG: efflux RND transporter periplasmic adaptor subunit, partial [Candidatus Eremiobacterota bacterium]